VEEGRAGKRRGLQVSASPYLQERVQAVNKICKEIYKFLRKREKSLPNLAILN